jgi:cell division protein FtsW (lipid II flippase)
MGVIAGIPALLIILQPDLGTMLVLSATVFGVLAVAGVRDAGWSRCSSRRTRGDPGVMAGC